MKIYHGYCNSYNGNDYLAEIWQGASGTDEENELVLSGIDIEWQGNGKQLYDLDQTLLPSKCTVGFVMRNSTDKAAFEAFKDYAETTFALKIYKNGSLFWLGRVLADQCTFDRKDPLTGEDIVNISAVDVLELIKGYDVDSTWFSIDNIRESVLDFIIDVLSVTELTDYWGTSDRFVCDGTAHYNANQDSGAQLKYNSVHLSSFVSNPDPFLASEKLRFISCKDALQSILHTYNARIMMSEGSYWVLQVPQYVNDDYPFIPYNKSAGTIGGSTTFPYHVVDTTEQRPKFEIWPVKSFQPPVREVRVSVDRRFGTVVERTSPSTSAFTAELPGCRSSNIPGTVLTSPGYPVKAYFELYWDFKVQATYKYRIWYKIYATDGVTNYAYDAASQSFVTFTSLGYYIDVDTTGWKQGQNASFVILDMPEPPTGYTTVHAECYVQEILGKAMWSPGRTWVSWASPVTTNIAFYGTCRITQAQQNTSPYAFDKKTYYRGTNGSTNNSILPEFESRFYNGKKYDIGSIQVFSGAAWVDPGNWTTGWDVIPDGDIAQIMCQTYAAMYWKYIPAYSLILHDNGDYLPHMALNFDDSQKWLFNGGTFNASLERWNTEHLGLDFSYATISVDSGDNVKKTKNTDDYVLGELDKIRGELYRVNAVLGNLPVKIIEHFFNEATGAPSSDPGSDARYGMQLQYTYDATQPTIELAMSPVSNIGASWVTVLKQTTTTVNSDNTPNDDPELVIQMLQDMTYVLRGVIKYNTDATADYQFGMSGITGDITFTYKYIPPHSTTQVVQTDNALPTGVAATGTGDAGGHIEIDAIITPDADGTLTFQWAQNTSDAASTSTLKGSYIEYMEVPELPAVDEFLLIESGDSRLLESGDRRLLG